MNQNTCRNSSSIHQAELGSATKAAESREVEKTAPISFITARKDAQSNVLGRRSFVAVGTRRYTVTAFSTMLSFKGGRGSPKLSHFVNSMRFFSDVYSEVFLFSLSIISSTSDFDGDLIILLDGRCSQGAVMLSNSRPLFCPGGGRNWDLRIRVHTHRRCPLKRMGLRKREHTHRRCTPERMRARSLPTRLRDPQSSVRHKHHDRHRSGRFETIVHLKSASLRSPEPALRVYLLTLFPTFGSGEG